MTLFIKNSKKICYYDISEIMSVKLSRITTDKNVIKNRENMR